MVTKQEIQEWIKNNMEQKIQDGIFFVAVFIGIVAIALRVIQTILLFL